MSAYFEVIAAFVVLGAYIFGLFRLWYRYLVGLASRYDIPARRKRAAILFPLVLLLFIVPVLAAVFFGIRATPTIGHLAVIALLCSLAPGVIWWFRRMPSLYALGYGRQR
jgi:hypothetical protein